MWIWTIELHRKLLGDSIRNKAFQDALKQVIKKNKKQHVLDLGAGTGFLGFLASRLGASQVSLVEYSEETSQLSRKLGTTNKITNVEYLPFHSTEITKPKKADIVISETLGCFALEENLLENMIEAKRFLKEDGILIPGKVEQFIAPIISSKHHEEIAKSWTNISTEFQLDFSQAKSISLSKMFQRSIGTDEIWNGQKSVKKWDSIDFTTSKQTSKSSAVEWTIQSDKKSKEKKGNIRIYGFGVWWTAELVPGITLSTSPWSSKTHWEQAYLPLFDPIECQDKDELKVSLIYDSNYEEGIDVSWKTQLIRNRKVVYFTDSKSF